MRPPNAATEAGSALFAENEAANGCSADSRHVESAAREMRDKKFAGHFAAPATGALRQTPDVAHVASKRATSCAMTEIAGWILQCHACRLRVPPEGGPAPHEVRAKTMNRIGQAHVGRCSERKRITAYWPIASSSYPPSQPMAEVRDAAQIIALCVTLSPSPQILAHTAKRRAEEYSSLTKREAVAER